MEGTGAAGQLNALLRDEITGMESLLEVLAREYDALKDLRSAALEQVVRQKQACLLNIEAATTRRRGLLENEGLPAEETAHGVLARNAEGHLGAELVARWRRLEVLATEIRRRNTINGALLDVNRQRVTRALAILQGREPEVALYAPDTQDSHPGPSRPLATA